MSAEQTEHLQIASLETSIRYCSGRNDGVSGLVHAAPARSSTLSGRGGKTVGTNVCSDVHRMRTYSGCCRRYPKPAATALAIMCGVEDHGHPEQSWWRCSTGFGEHFRRPYARLSRRVDR